MLLVKNHQLLVFELNKKGLICSENIGTGENRACLITVWHKYLVTGIQNSESCFQRMELQDYMQMGWILIISL